MPDAPIAKPPRVAARSKQIVARKTPDDEFLALLRRKCVRAASVGALTAIGESIPGLSRALGFIFGELLDAKFLAAIQRELVEDTFVLYGLELPPALHDTIVKRVQMIGAGASIASDAVVRRMLQHAVGKLGGFVARRALPLTAIASSAFSNAAVTYAIGKRAQAVARLRDAPITAMPDAIRAFSGVDERRMFEWSLEAVKSSLGLAGKALRGLVKSASPKKSKSRRATAS
jgi:uncharacterized protein (DUF697 family)